MTKEKLYHELEGLCTSYLSKKDVSEIKRAYLFADRAHEGQLRKSGIPYITHPISASLILARMQVDALTIVTALLHDVPEDTKYTLEDIEEMFGMQVAQLVAGITKLSAVHYNNNMIDRQVDTLRKMFLVMAKDIRVILVKLADRLHNMQTLEHVKPEKAHRIAKETLEIYSPLAHLLGLWEIRQEIEDQCFKYLNPEIYKTFSKDVSRHRKGLSQYLGQLEKTLHKLCAKFDIVCVIDVRWKHLYSVYKKMSRNHQSDFLLYDLPSITIILPTVDDCYKTLGALHSLYRPKPGSFKDYIAVPKMNGYRSLHTIVFGPKGELCEFHLRTEQMDQEAKYGVAARFIASRIGKRADINEFLKTCPWVLRIMKLQDKSNDEFIEDVKRNVLSDRVFVFSIEGDMMDLPKGSTPLDYAYRYSKRVGNEYDFALVNKDKKPLSYELETGDIVEIITSHNVLPSRDWLQFVVTDEAKRAIKFYFTKSSSHEKEKIGESVLDTALSILHKGDFRNYSTRTKETIMRHMGYKTVKSMLRDVATGEISEEVILKELSQNPTKFFENQTFFLNSWMSRLFMRRQKPQTLRVWFKVYLEDRVGILADIMEVLSHYKINIVKMTARGNGLFGISAKNIFQVEVDDINNLRRAIHAISHIRGVVSIKQVNTQRSIMFISSLVAMFCAWVGHPYFIYYIHHSEQAKYLVSSESVFWSSLIVLYTIFYYSKKYAIYTLPRAIDKNAFVMVVNGLFALAFGVLVLEVISLSLAVNLYLFAVVGAVGMYSLYRTAR